MKILVGFVMIITVVNVSNASAELVEQELNFLVDSWEAFNEEIGTTETASQFKEDLQDTPAAERGIIHQDWVEYKDAMGALFWDGLLKDPLFAGRTPEQICGQVCGNIKMDLTELSQDSADNDAIVNEVEGKGFVNDGDIQKLRDSADKWEKEETSLNLRWRAWVGPCRQYQTTASYYLYCPDPVGYNN